MTTTYSVEIEQTMYADDLFNGILIKVDKPSRSRNAPAESEESDENI